MTGKNLRFALFGNVHHPENSAAISRLLTALQRHGAQIAVDQHYYDFLTTLPDNPLHETHYSVFTELPPSDFAFSLGGDGTLLKTASRVRSHQVPIVGVNMGRMGFLADVGADEVEACVDALYLGDYTVDDRALIQVTTNGEHIEGCDCALNDVAILKRDTASMISIRASIDGEHLATYQADGLIVSTPTGSTAYSLSNGGPIITPRTGVLLMTAVAPHSLNIRPIVIPDSASIELTVSSRSHTFLVAIDGRSQTMPEGATIHLHRAPYTAKIVKRSGSNYFSTLRQKLMWAADSRIIEVRSEERASP
ncbi:MAG: NAD kinase [Prevotella sp.]|nr:NAD kinase [Prevotella sp.]